MKKPVPVPVKTPKVKRTSPAEVVRSLGLRLHETPGMRPGYPISPKTQYKREKNPMKWAAVEDEHPGYNFHEVKIGFQADANNPGAVKLPKGSNFAWTGYQVLFSTKEKIPRYFYLNMELEQDGTERPGISKVLMSDSKFNPPRESRAGIKGPVTIKGDEVVAADPTEAKAFADSIKKAYGGLDLNPSGEGLQCTYRNVLQKKSYEQKDFLRTFVSSGKYTIPGPGGKLVDPLKGDVTLGLTVPKGEDMGKRTAVRAAMERLAAGRDVMRKFVKEERTKQGLPSPASGDTGTYTGGFGEVQDWQKKKPSGSDPQGFDIMEKTVKTPEPIKFASEEVNIRAWVKKEFPHADDFDVEAALWWYANDWHSGQGSWQYSMLSKSKFHPSPLHNKIEQEGDEAKEIYDALVEKLEKGKKATDKAIVTFKFKDMATFDKAQELLKEGMKLGTKHFDYGVIKNRMEINVPDRKNAETISAWWDFKNLDDTKFSIDEGVSRIMDKPLVKASNVAAA